MPQTTVPSLRPSRPPNVEERPVTSVLRTLRALAATVLAVVLLQLGALVASSSADANNQTVIATTWVNIRSGPGTKYAKLGILNQGQTLEMTGRTGVWAIVKYKGRTAYIHTDYLSIRTVAAQQVASGGATGTRYSTGRLNVRTGASLTSTVVTTVDKGTAFALTGRTSNGFVEVTYSGQARWVWSEFLTSSGGASSSSPTPASTLPAVTGQMRLTGQLMIRTDDTANFTSLGKLPIGSIIDVTGVQRNGVVQAIYQGQVRWFDAAWVVPVSSSASAPTAPSAPATIGTRYSNDTLNVRAQASQSSALLATAPKGTTFQVTGKITDGYAEIVWQGRSAWVAAQYLIAPQGSLLTSWSSGLDSLLPNGKGIVNAVRQQFPQISVMYGVRFDPIPDHPSGKAVDIMLPDYKNNQALGKQIAEYMRANAKRLNIRYVIFAQQVWNIERDAEGWRAMADRGSDNNNHYNHIHVTTY